MNLELSLRGLTSSLWLQYTTRTVHCQYLLCIFTLCTTRNRFSSAKHTKPLPKRFQAKNSGKGFCFYEFNS